MSALPSVSARAMAQQNRILHAARACFVERGFHGASMASIAETANISPGLIYRYFDGKSDIIRGIVEQQLELMAEELQRPNRNASTLIELLLESYYGDQTDRQDKPELHPGLIMEMSAEAARDPIIGSALREFDDTVKAHVEDWMRKPVEQNGLGISGPEVAARSLMLRMVIDGLKMRQARQPDLDPALLRSSLEELLTPLLTA